LYDYEVVRLLLNHGADPKARDDREQHMASSRGHLDIARLLLEHGSDVDAKDEDNRTAYQVALDKGHDEVVQLRTRY
jgi:ankyrin repeat protein